MDRKKKFWVREASLNRLNMLFKNKTESISILRSTNIALHDLDSLETSGLSELEVLHLQKWLGGQVSGRQCMVALLETRHLGTNSVVSDKVGVNPLTFGVISRPPEFSMLGTSLSLPDEFLCDSGYLYEKIFSKPPSAVVKEALRILTTKAMETNISALRVDQINLALKQLKIENLCAVNSASGDSSEPNTDSITDADQTALNQQNIASSYHLSILIELIRMQIMNASSCTTNEARDPETANKENGGSHTKSRPSPRSSQSNPTTLLELDVPTLEKHLETPIDVVVEEAERLHPDLLEKTNGLLKPYIRQLSELKASLTTQIKDLADTKAYISLGISKDATAAAIKKAYHKKAIALHPDKPGGDTEKFQQLQACYQEILEKRKSYNADDDARLASQADPKTKEETLHARTLLNAMATALADIKAAADRCSQLGQLNIQWQKAIDKAAARPFPRGLAELNKLMNYSVDAASNGGDASPAPAAGVAAGEVAAVGKKKKSPLTVDKEICSAQHVVAHLEVVCESMQNLATVAMKLPGCGFRYGLAAAVHTTYMKTVETVMNTGLGSMKLVSSLLTADEQISSCQRRADDLSPQADSEEIHDILVEMISTAFRGSTATVGMAAEKAVDAAVAAADLYAIAHDIVLTGEKEAVDEAKRATEKREQDAEMCAEDRAHMEEMRRKQRDEAHKRAEVEEEEEQKRQKAQEEEEEKHGTVEVLRKKIRSLQVQLRVQHVQALQTLNGETRGLQKQLQRELRQIVQAASPGASTGSTSPRENAETAAGVSGSCTTDSAASSPRGGPESTSSLTAASLLSLLADFIDSSCNLLREEAETIAAAKKPDEIQMEVEHDCTVDGDELSLPHMREKESLLPPPPPPLLLSRKESRPVLTPILTHAAQGEITSTEILGGSTESSEALLISGLVQRYLGWMSVLLPSHREASPSDKDCGQATASSSSSSTRSEGTTHDEAGATSPSELGADANPAVEDMGDRGDMPAEESGSLSTPLADIDEGTYSTEPALADVDGVDIVGDVDNSSDKEDETVRGGGGGGGSGSAAGQGGSHVPNHVPGAADKDEPEESTKTSAQAEDSMPETHHRPLPPADRLALLPDVRSRILWLSSLVDEVAVEDMVRYELVQRLTESIRMVANSPAAQQAVCNSSAKAVQSSCDYAEIRAQEFCCAILAGVQATVQELVR